jgi:phenylpropionate dioxygenase-like ring-hydroxylating dioxygenase large terminal subunit
VSTEFSAEEMASVQEIFAADPGPRPPAPFVTESRESFGLEDIPIERYTSREFLQLEYERIWSRTWQWACREEEIPHVGDYTTYDIGDRSVVVVRSAPDRIQAFHNSCLHRGTQLKVDHGNSKTLMCPFHGWTWNLDGSLNRIPCKWDFPQVDAEKFGLPEVRLERWGGFVFVNFDDEAPPLSEALDVVPEHFGQLLNLENTFTAAHVAKILPVNWKAGIEAFLESYHTIATHPGFLEFAGDANTQYDVWSTASRLISPIGVSSPHLGGAEDSNAIFQAAIDNMFGAGIDLPQLTEGSPPRVALAEWLTGMYKTALGVDLADASIAEVIDTLQYFVFPNWFPWGSLALPLQYRFRPNGHDPDSCIMEIYYLYPIAAGQERPPAAPMRWLGPEESYTSVPELGQMAAVFDQDFQNMAKITRGMKASAKKGLTISDYQESRIRHFHHQIDRWMATP